MFVPKTFQLNEWTYVDAGGNQLWRERLLWEIDGKKLRHPVKDRRSLSIQEFIKARSSLAAKS